MSSCGADMEARRARVPSSSPGRGSEQGTCAAACQGKVGCVEGAVGGG